MSLWKTDPSLREETHPHTDEASIISVTANIHTHTHTFVTEPFTQFESSSQSSNDSDGVGGICAELVQRGEESISLVLQLVQPQETESNYFFNSGAKN